MNRPQHTSSSVSIHRTCRLATAALALLAVSTSLAAPVVQQIGSSEDRIFGRLTVSRVEMTTVEELELVIEVSANPMLDLLPIDFAEQLRSQWTVVSLLEEPMAVRGRVGMRTTIMLEPFLPGEYSIPSLTISYLDGSQQQGKDPRQIRTEPVNIVVRSVLHDEQEAEVTGIKPIVEPPPAFPWWIVIVAGGALLALAIFGLLILILTRRLGRERLVRSTAHQIALARLEHLLSEDLPARGMYKRFYLSISYILRCYIEDRFGMRAPEQTTEEFLAASRSARLISGDELVLLERFLAHCDEVKFAGMQPTDAQSAEAVETVRAFIGRTKAPDEQIVQTEREQREQAARAKRWLATEGLAPVGTDGVVGGKERGHAA